MTDRLDRVRTLINELGCDALVLTSPASRRHATGFSSASSTSFSTDVAIVTPDRCELLVSPIHVEWARGEASGVDEISALQGGFPASLASRLSALDVGTVALEADHLPYPDAQSLQSLLPDVTFRFETNLKHRLRQVKDETELRHLQEAARVTDEVFESFSDWLKPGITERSAARWISARLLERGDGLGFDVIVASGPNAARPHHRPSDRAIQEREPVIIDMGARIEGYCGDLTRTLWIGEPTDRFEDAYRAVLKAQIDTNAVMKDGTPVADVALAADKSLQDSGYGEYILHSVGHGLGLEIHESPSIRKDLTAVLVANSVVTVEPGVYIPGWGGVRVEDVVVVGSDLPRTLTTASKLYV
ncbi:MAG: Xaa-Pro peptidase family protein [Chloroflexota bacterium]|nr:Xaa-Pro peptidase family protein [Chloroflexota bacterium]